MNAVERGGVLSEDDNISKFWANPRGYQLLWVLKGEGKLNM